MKNQCKKTLNYYKTNHIIFQSCISETREIAQRLEHLSGVLEAGVQSLILHAPSYPHTLQYDSPSMVGLSSTDSPGPLRSQQATQLGTV